MSFKLIPILTNKKSKIKKNKNKFKLRGKLCMYLE